MSASSHVPAATPSTKWPTTMKIPRPSPQARCGRSSLLRSWINWSYREVLALIARSPKVRIDSRRQVIHRGLGPQLRMQRKAAALLDQPRHFAGRIIQVAESARDRRAVRHARGELPFAPALAAEIALHHHVGLVARHARALVVGGPLREIVLRLVVEIAVAVRAGHHAGLAAHALVVVDVHHP